MLSIIKGIFALCFWLSITFLVGKVKIMMTIAKKNPYPLTPAFFSFIGFLSLIGGAILIKERGGDYSSYIAMVAVALLVVEYGIRQVEITRGARWRWRLATAGFFSAIAAVFELSTHLDDQMLVPDQMAMINFSIIMSGMFLAGLSIAWFPRWFSVLDQISMKRGLFVHVTKGLAIWLGMSAGGCIILFMIAAWGAS